MIAEINALMPMLLAFGGLFLLGLKVCIMIAILRLLESGKRYLDRNNCHVP